MAFRIRPPARTRVAQLPSVPGLSDARLRSFLESLKQAVEVGEGVRGDPLDTKLTIRDLAEIGVLDIQGGTLGLGSSVRNDSGPAPGTIGEDGYPIVTTPFPVRGFTATGLFTRVALTWDLARYSPHDRTDIYRAEVDDFGQAVKIGSSTGVMYSDPVGGGWTGYYWARHVSRGGVEGPVAGPAVAQTPTDPSYMIEVLQDQLDESVLVESLRGKIKDGGTYEQEFDEINSQWTLKIDSNGNVAGIGLMNDGATSSLAVVADQFAIAAPDGSGASSPFFHLTTPQVVNGVQLPAGTYLDVAHIGTAQITSAQIGEVGVDKITGDVGNFVSSNIEDGSITNAKIGSFIQSNNWPSAGWHLNKNNTFTMKSGSSGARMEITTTRIDVRDANGVLRVRLGQL